MAEFENMDQAAQALAAAVSGADSPAQSDFAAGTPVGDPNQLAVTPPESTPTQGEPGDQSQQAAPEPTVPEFTPSKDIDLSGLTDEQREFLQAREREMQAHFTRATQELSQQRQEAEQAIQFISELNTNPFFAQQVVQELSQSLQAAGMSPAAADAQALQQVQDTQTQGQQDYGYEDDGFDDDPYMQEINSLRQQQAQVQQFLASQAEAQRVAALEAQLHRQAAAVQQTNGFSDEEMMKVVNMSYAYGGNMDQAAQEYRAIKEAALQDYIKSKEGVTAPAAVPAGGGAQAAPAKFEDLNDPRLEAAAIRRLNEAGFGT